MPLTLEQLEEVRALIGPYVQTPVTLIVSQATYDALSTEYEDLGSSIEEIESLLNIKFIVPVWH